MASNKKSWGRTEIAASVVMTAVLLLIAVGGLYLGCWFLDRFVEPDNVYPSVPNAFVGLLVILIFTGLPIAGIAYIWLERPYYSVLDHIH